MLGAARVNQLLAPYGLALGPQETQTLLTYLEVLLRWNQRINLTAVQEPEECVTRHFGESLSLAKWFTLRGRLLDVGSGAGFPGLALKILAPELAVTLLEPVAKKRAFLKEVKRACEFDLVEVRGERLEDYLRVPLRPLFEFATARAVGNLKELTRDSAKCLLPGGRLCLWLSDRQAMAVAAFEAGFIWDAPKKLLSGRQSLILVGSKSGGQS